MDAIIEHLSQTKYLFESILILSQIIILYLLTKFIFAVRNMSDAFQSMKTYFDTEIKVIKSDVEKNERKYDEISKIVYVVQGQMGYQNGK